jgi:type III secretory pathway component EscS
MKTMLRHITLELAEHTPFTIVGAVIGIIIMVIIQLANTPGDVSEALFYTFHPLHIVFSALVTTALYRKQKGSRPWLIIIVGYTGSIGIATLSDAIIPYLGGNALNIAMEFHLPFLETEIMPYIGIPEWIIVNAAAVIGIAIGYFKPATKLPHMGHVLLSTWASLFSFTAFGVADWIPVLPFVFLFLFFAVWLPCCVSDIIYPLLWVREKERN